MPDGVLVFSSHGGLRQPEPNGWPGRGEKSVYRRTKARTGAALRQAPAQKKRGGRRATLLVPPRGVACGASGRRITSGLALSSPPLTCAGSEIATNPGDQGSAAQCGQGQVRPDIEGHGAPPRSHWAPQPQPPLYSVWAQAAVAGSTQWLTMLKGVGAASVMITRQAARLGLLTIQERRREGQ